MGGWTDEKMERWMDGLIGGWKVDGWMNELVDEWIGRIEYQSKVNGGRWADKQKKMEMQLVGKLCNCLEINRKRKMDLTGWSKPPEQGCLQRPVATFPRSCSQSPQHSWSRVPWIHSLCLCCVLECSSFRSISLTLFTCVSHHHLYLNSALDLDLWYCLVVGT